MCLAAASALSACEGQTGEATTTPNIVGKNVQVRTVDAPVEAALTAIPPELRSAHHQALACEVKRNNATKGAKAIAVTPAYLRDLLDRLKADPAIAKC